MIIIICFLIPLILYFLASKFLFLSSSSLGVLFFSAHRGRYITNTWAISLDMVGVGVQPPQAKISGASLSYGLLMWKGITLGPSLTIICVPWRWPLYKEKRTQENLMILFEPGLSHAWKQKSVLGTEIPLSLWII